jgi:2-succinyl-5-enolpyruvyl-6-hydroxy-3-cyclohexene-1-carboxylate synthase
MEIKINRNILWTETFVNELVLAGIKYACISPGSRNTPLTLAFANNKKIRSFVLVDERSTGFFALGLAKSSNSPVVLVCTSGTATAEFYPAIIEAYQNRVPLIVCTADRPPELLDVGANQTINQNNLYKNHIRWFVDIGLPEPTVRRLKHIKSTARRAVYESFIKSKGPVHLNFPFRKPFEPEFYTDKVDKATIDFANANGDDRKNFIESKDGKNLKNEKWFKEVANFLMTTKKGLIIAGPEDYNPYFARNLIALARRLNYPILADGCSNIRFGNHDKKLVVSNYDAFLRSETFAKKIRPDFILHFGRTITSKALDTFLENCNAPRYMINDYGDWFDPSNKSLAAYDCKPYIFCERMNELLEEENFLRKAEDWLDIYLNADKTTGKIKEKLIDDSPSFDEPCIISEIINELPDNSLVMISNSMPVRDFDYFASNSDKKLTIFNNRGASGIDGITSTALGIKCGSNKPTVLITGDLAFYYDLNGLLAAYKYSLPLIIILINNNGGGIFEILPISSHGKIFKDYFIAPLNLDFSYFVSAYKGNYKKIKDRKNFQKTFKDSLTKKNITVIEIPTDSKKSLSLRKRFWKEVSKKMK